MDFARGRFKFNDLEALKTPVGAQPVPPAVAATRSWRRSVPEKIRHLSRRSSPRKTRENHSEIVHASAFYTSNLCQLISTDAALPGLSGATN